jgi:hypothetical protein
VGDKETKERRAFALQQRALKQREQVERRRVARARAAAAAAANSRLRARARDGASGWCSMRVRRCPRLKNIQSHSPSGYGVFELGECPPLHLIVWRV